MQHASAVYALCIYGVIGKRKKQFRFYCVEFVAKIFRDRYSSVSCVRFWRILFNPLAFKVNPCEAVEIKRHKSKHVKALTPEETQIVIDLAAGSS